MTHPTWGDKPPRVAGSLPRMRPDQELQAAVTRAGSGPAPQSPVVVAREVIVIGPSGGIFIYDNAGNLRAADVGQTTTDPKQGITCQQGISTFNGHGAVISLNSTAPGSYGFFVYIDTGTSTQGALQNVDSPINGTEPVTSKAYLQGFTAFNTLTGASTRMTPNADIHLSAVPFTSDGGISAGVQGTGPAAFTQVSSPAQGPVKQSFLRLYGENAAGTQGPFALLTALSAGSYGTEIAFYFPATGASADDGAAVTALFALGIKVICLVPGTYTGVTTAIGNENQYILPLGGFQAVTWNLVTTGIPAFQWKQAAAGTYVTTASGGILDPGLTIVGPSGTANPSDGTIGVQMADIPHLKCTAQVIRCQTPFLSSNQNFFTEQADFKIYTKDCTNGPIFQVAASGGAGRTGSFDRTKIFWSADETLNASYGQGLQLLAGASFEGGRIEQVGNWKGTGKAGVFALVVSGNFGASNSDIVSCDLVHALEYDGTGTAIGTISVAAPNSITPATGRLDYGSNFGPSSIAGNWSFSGPVNGDDTLLTNLWTVQNSGFLAGWTGTVKFRWAGNQKGLFGAQAGDMAALDIALTIAAGTTITSGTTVFTLPAGYFFATNNKRIIVTLAQFGLSPIAAFLTIGTAGAVTWSGATVTVPVGGTSSVFGDAVYPVLV